MENDNPLTYEKAVESSTDAGTATRPKLKQAVTESPRVRKSKARPIFNEQLNQTRIVGEDIHGPRLNIVLHPLVEVLDLEGHGAC